MKILLIAPASGNWQKVGRVKSFNGQTWTKVKKADFFNGKTFRFSLLGLLSVAAETPKDVNVIIIDEQIEDILQASILTPFLGTPIYNKMKNRIFDFNWARYNLHNVVFHPKGMSAEDLQAGHDWLTHEFYQPWRITKRLWKHIRRPKGWSTFKYLAAVNRMFQVFARANSSLSN